MNSIRQPINVDEVSGTDALAQQANLLASLVEAIPEVYGSGTTPDTPVRALIHAELVTRPGTVPITVIFAAVARQGARLGGLMIPDATTRDMGVVPEAGGLETGSISPGARVWRLDVGELSWGALLALVEEDSWAEFKSDLLHHYAIAIDA